MPNGNQLARFTYNQRMELVKSVRDRGGCGPDEVHTYAYDLNHNWTKKDGVSYTNNIADQLLAVAGGGSLSYNDSGQATDVQGWDVTYNCADQITGILAPGKNIAYRYDGAGQRVEKTVNGVSQKFLWNGGDIAKEYAADGSVRADYFLGAGREGIKTNGQWHWYLSDIQGSTLMLTDASGHSAATYDYSDYGETRQTSGSTTLYNPFLYTGQEYDFETSLYHLRARHYSPDKGRFFSRDPIGYAGGSNMYAYCGGDPVNQIDPSGLEIIQLYDAQQTMRDVQMIAEGKSATTAKFHVNLIWDTDASVVKLTISDAVNFGLSDLVISGSVSVTPTRLSGNSIKDKGNSGGNVRLEVLKATASGALPMRKSFEWKVGKSVCTMQFVLDLSAQHENMTQFIPPDFIKVRTFRALPVHYTGRASKT